MDIQESARESLVKINWALTRYARERAPENYVGQFFDKEGCRSPQHGVYGISTWILLTADADHDWPDPVTELRNACKRQLCSWILEASEKTLEELERQPDEATYELRRIAPKTAAAFHALLREQDSSDAAALLQGFLSAAQCPDGSWGSLLDNKRGEAVVTALVLRAISDSPSCSRQKREALRYLDESSHRLADYYKRLYVLNTILSIDSDSDRIKRAKEGLRSTINKIYDSVRIHPIRYPNPINIDFHDVHRVRYFRLPTDIILLESLLLLAQNNLLLLHAHAGSRLLQDLLSCLDQQDLEKDTSGHRLSISALHYHKIVLRTLSHARMSRLPEAVRKLLGAAQSSFLFGRGYSFDLSVLVVSILAGIMTKSFGYGVISNIAFGVSAKSSVDLVRNVHDFFKGRG